MIYWSSGCRRGSTATGGQRGDHRQRADGDGEPLTSPIPENAARALHDTTIPGVWSSARPVRHVGHPVAVGGFWVVKIMRLAVMFNGVPRLVCGPPPVIETVLI